MTTVEVKTILKMEHLPALVIYADVGFISGEGAYIECWEVLYHEPNTSRMWLKHADLSGLSYDDFHQVSEELTRLCDGALMSETIYNDLEASFMDHLENWEE